MPDTTPFSGSPRALANKSMKQNLFDAIRMALQVQSAAVRHNTQSFNQSKNKTLVTLPDYQQLKDRARAIKERSIAALPELITTLEASVKRNGGHFHLAVDAKDASTHITDICTKAGVRLLTKGKSMTSEEVGLNHALEAAGIEVVETDLAEFILQAADEQPSHIIAPAIHYSRERITALFKRVFHTDDSLTTGEELTRFARERLREKFLAADAGITGANFIAADSGTLMLVESEGNIRMTSMMPPLHIAIVGVEKIIPTRADFAPFLELLAASATGQKLSAYTSIIQPPLDAAPVLADLPRQREFHLVLVDNGRMKLRQDPALHDALYCIRCSACLNVCANFQTVGGHAFGGETYSGGIGGTWEATTRGLANSRFSELCTGCSRCLPQCPVRIDIPWLNTVLRQRINRNDAEQTFKALEIANSGVFDDDEGASLQKNFFGRYDVLGKWGSRLAPFSNWMNSLSLNRLLLEKMVGLDQRRKAPAFAEQTLVDLFQDLPTQQVKALENDIKSKVVLFADIFTNYGSPSRGMAAIKILRHLGIDVTLSEVTADGRAALSQGLIATAKEQAEHTASKLLKYIEDGRDVIVVEPSVLAMFRLDYRHLLDSPKTLDKIQHHSYEAIEFIWEIIRRHGLDPTKLFPAAKHSMGTKLFYHSHCQQKTMNCAIPTEELLRAAGFDVVTSKVECCGMAGSFGYKKEFYDLSMAVGQDLFDQVIQTEMDGSKRTLVASGTSCCEQLQAGLHRPVLHPLELLVELIP